MVVSVWRRTYPKRFAGYRKAAEQGHANAQNSLAICYENGTGVEKIDLTKAVEWYRLAADQDNMYAQYNLARHFHARRFVGIFRQPAQAIFVVVSKNILCDS